MSELKKKKTKRKFGNPAIIAAFVISAILIIESRQRLNDFFLPIKLTGAILAGQSHSRWNRIDLGPEISRIIDSRLVPLDPQENYSITYDLFIRHMGGLAVTAICRDGTRVETGTISDNHLWPFSSEISEFRSVRLTLLRIPDKFVIQLNNIFQGHYAGSCPMPYEVELAFQGGEISILNSSVEKMIQLPGPSNVKQLMVSELRSPVHLIHPFLIPITACFILLAVMIGFLPFDSAAHRRDYITPLLVPAGIFFAIQLRTVRPEIFASLLMIFFSLKTFHVFLESKDHRYQQATATIVLLICGSVMSSGLRQGGTVLLLSLAGMVMIGLQKSIRDQRDLRYPQLIPVLLVIILIATLEFAVRAAYRGDRKFLNDSVDGLGFQSKSEKSPDGAKDQVTLQNRILRKTESRIKPALVLVGGSVVYGSFTQANLNPAILLQRELGEQIDVYNAGIHGANSYYSVKKFYERIAPMKPEFVLAYLRNNDISQLGPLTMRKINEKRRLDESLRGLFGHSMLYQFLALKTVTMKSLFRLNRVDDNANVESLRANLEALADMVTEYKGRLILVPEVLKSEGPSHSTARRMKNQMIEVAKREGVDFEEVYFRELDEEGNRLILDNSHLSEKGYLHLTEGLAEIMRRKLQSLGTR